MVCWSYFFVILDLLKINYQLSVIDAPLGIYLSEPPNRWNDISCCGVLIFRCCFTILDGVLSNGIKRLFQSIWWHCSSNNGRGPLQLSGKEKVRWLVKKYSYKVKETWNNSTVFVVVYTKKQYTQNIWT
jgi:hypothetical protein